MNEVAVNKLPRGKPYTHFASLRVVEVLRNTSREIWETNGFPPTLPYLFLAPWGWVKGIALFRL